MTDFNEASLLALIEQIRGIKANCKVGFEGRKLVVRDEAVLFMGHGDWDAGIAAIEKVTGQRLVPVRR